MTQKTYIFIAGPTASGKSLLALTLAQRYQGAIINVDSMQVYQELKLLTARPQKAQMALVPHHLYGHRTANTPYSVALWLEDVAQTLQGLPQETVIFVGGTGLYFRALLEGLSYIPPIEEAVRIKWRLRLEALGAEHLYAQLAHLDPESAKRILPTDAYRLVRALEVLDMTGQPLSYWQKTKSPPFIETQSMHKMLLMPERDRLYAQIDARFDAMIREGAIEEVEALLAKDIRPSHPLMKAIGVRELAQYLEGRSSIAEAILNAKKNTRHYAKRQVTWFRHQFDRSWKVFQEPKVAL